MMIQDISEFSTCLWEPTDIVEVRCLLNGDSRRFWHYASELPGQADNLAALNEAGWNIYAGAAPRPGMRVSGDKSIELCRALFVDFDGKHLNGSDDYIDFVGGKIKAVGLPVPTMTVFSGHGVHCYWRLAEPLEPGRWKRANTRLSVVLGSDTSICNQERIMRIPGLMNNKPPAAPCVIVEHDPARTYRPEDFAALKEPEKRVEPTAPMPVRTKPASDQAVRAAAYAATWERLPEGEGRNQALYRHIKALVNDMQIPADIARQTVVEWNQGNIPPLSDRELEQTITDALKYANKKPTGCKNDYEPGVKSADKTASVRPVAERHLHHQVLSSVEPKKVEYLWPEIAPLGMIAGFVSQEGGGKSTVASDATMRVTTGTCWPNAPSMPNPKGCVIIFSHEEDLSRILVPRLIANGTDMNRVVAGENFVTTAGGEEEPFDIEHDIPELDALIDQFPETRLVIFDPITSYVHCLENSNAQVRRALKPLIDFAARRNVAILTLTHLNKKVDLGMINRTIGSRAWSAVPRITWGIRTEQVEDEDGHKTDTDSRFLLCIKSNIGPKPKGLRFSIAEGGCVIWDEDRVNLSLDGDCGIKTSRIDEAADWLQEYLGTKSMTSAAVFEDGEAAGYSRNLLYRAKDNLKVRASKIGFGGTGQWVWELPK